MRQQSRINAGPSVVGRGVFGIDTEATNDSKNCMIVVDGTGIHPNWANLTAELHNHGTGTAGPAPSPY